MLFLTGTDQDKWNQIMEESGRHLAHFHAHFPKTTSNEAK